VVHAPAVLTDELAQRIGRALREAGAARLAGVAAVPGNPLAIEVRAFGRTVCDLVGSDIGHYHYFNGPRLIASPEDAEAMAAWYRERERPIYVRVSPLDGTEPLLRALAEAGLQQTGFMSVLYGAAVPAASPPWIAEDPHAFVHLWTDDAQWQQLVHAEFSRGWRCYVARVGGTPAAYGALYLATHGVAVCAAAATRPEYRGRGLQATLLKTRMSEAAKAGCDLIVAQASPGSTSQRNMHRVGLLLAYTSVTWTW
jgi:GNAT superfamily N-acetyltransferase